MKDHLTTVRLTEDTLAARMSLTVPGQATWVDMKKKAKCVDCAHYADGKVTKGKFKGCGRCSLVRALTKKNGTLFNGKSALACSKFERPILPA